MLMQSNENYYAKGGVANRRRAYKTHNPAAIVLEQKKVHAAKNWRIWAA